MRWIQSPAVAGDSGKYYVTDAKAAVYTSPDRPVGTRWTETTPPVSWVAPGELVVPLADAPTIATDAALGEVFAVTLGGNRTLGNPTHLRDGQRLVWRLAQDATGGRTLTLGSMFYVNTGVTGSIVLSGSPNKVDYLGAVYRAGTATLDVLAFGRGY